MLAKNSPRMPNAKSQKPMHQSVCRVELELSGPANPRRLLRIALLRASVIILEMQEERTKDFSRTFVFLCSMLGGLRGCNLKPPGGRMAGRVAPGGWLPGGRACLWHLDMSPVSLFIGGVLSLMCF